MTSWFMNVRLPVINSYIARYVVKISYHTSLSIKRTRWTSLSPANLTWPVPIAHQTPFVQEQFESYALFSTLQFSLEHVSDCHSASDQEWLVELIAAHKKYDINVCDNSSECDNSSVRDNNGVCDNSCECDNNSECDNSGEPDNSSECDNSNVCDINGVCDNSSVCMCH